jgi:hypothetical protein
LKLYQSINLNTKSAAHPVSFTIQGEDDRQPVSRIQSSHPSLRVRNKVTAEIRENEVAVCAQLETLRR